MGASVSALMATHAADLLALDVLVRGELTAAGDINTPTDDLFLLRYVLSQPDVAAAAASLRVGVAWRKAHLASLRQVAHSRSHDLFYAARRFQAVAFCGSVRGGHPIFVVSAATSDMRGFMAAQPMEEVAHMMCIEKEAAYQYCDAKTRETGTMVKLVGVVNLAGASLLNFDRRFPRAAAKASALSADVFPQLLGLHSVCNPPGPMRWLMALFNKLMPKSAVKKQRNCPGRSTGKGADPSKCPFMSKFHAAPVVPAFMGGSLADADLPAQMRAFESRPSVAKFKLKAGAPPHQCAALVVAKGEKAQSIVHLDSPKTEVRVAVQVGQAPEQVHTLAAARKAVTLFHPVDDDAEQTVHISISVSPASAKGKACHGAYELRAPFINI